ncbi:hypothetical protein DXV76_07315 [Rhodobacteraceae bacterium CCMM004]|nr:hypothetical protein DXV76_07315 [Rhodobacteraceae bacterium CCMM004]
MRSLAILAAAALAACNAVVPGGGEVEVSAAAVPGGFGSVEAVCDLPAGALGTEADSRGGWRLYDTQPGSAAPRAHHITGFDDGCVRRITAALVLFGSAALHETHRYSPANGTPWTATDEVYETVKARVCGVARQTPCPPDRLDRLERRVTFATAYPTLGGASEWLELMLDDGRLAAQSLRSN